MTTPRTRAPRGVPVGGQFVTVPKMESGIVDDGSEKRHADQMDFYLEAMRDPSVEPAADDEYDEDNPPCCCDDETCPHHSGPCDGATDDGEGFDGKCGNCADHADPYDFEDDEPEPTPAPVPPFEPVAPDVNWGGPYMSSVAYLTPDGPVWMRRRGSRVRYYNADGIQVGPEQDNVAPAVGYAHSQGWGNPNLFTSIG